MTEERATTFHHRDPDCPYGRRMVDGHRLLGREAELAQVAALLAHARNGRAGALLRAGEIDVPMLVVHGDDDQIVPIDVGGARSARLVDGAVLTVYEGSGHALPDTDRDRLHADLLAVIDS